MENPTLEYQLGFYVGEYIYHRFLPTLSTDMLQSRKVIQVSEEDSAENKRLEEEWWSKKQKSKRQKDNIDPIIDDESWKAYHAHNKMLEKKYLPHQLKCRVPQVFVENIDEFKKGIINSLWDSDLCAYSLKPKNIKIEREKYFTLIELVLGCLVND